MAAARIMREMSRRRRVHELCADEPPPSLPP
jgi:hypothetical protein